MMNDDQNVKDISRISRSDEVTKRLLALIDQLGYQLVQENGQRRLTSSNVINNTTPRTKGAEVFLGRLPRDCYEDELVPILMKIGRVVELRLMMDFSGSTRGYAFASFEHPRIARKACDQLNGYEIRAGHKIGVVKSIDNCRLFLGGVPKDKTKDDFMIELGKMLDGIINIYVYPSTEDKALNRGFVFVEFKDHRSAAMARRKLIPGRVMLWDHEVAVDWADPEPGQDVDDDIMETVSALFVRNLSLTSTEQEIRNIIQRVTGIQMMKIKKINHFAFLHYENRAQAQRVLELMKQESCAGISNESSAWEFTWAKPIRKSEKLQEHLRCSDMKNNHHQDAKNQGNNQKTGVGVLRYENGRKINCESNNKNRDKKKILGPPRGNDNYNNRERNSPSSSVCSMTNMTSNINNNNINKTICTLEDSKRYTNYINNNTISTLLVQPNDNMTINENGNMNLHDDQRYFYNHNYSINHHHALSSCKSQDVNYTDDYLTQCAKALADLAATRFHANLRYEYWKDPLGSEYYCKIILERNGCELMNYQGTPAGTMHEALRSTVPTAYTRMQSMLMNSKGI